MRTDADRERRNARYLACVRADRETAGPRRIASDDAPSLRWKSAPDGSRAANKQRWYPVAKRGRLHGASELDVQRRNRSAENKFVYYRRLKEERRWQQSTVKHNRLRWQDKRPHIARRSVGCFFRIFRRVPHVAAFLRNVRQMPKALYLRPLFHIAERHHGR